jgi:3-oxoacyl-[acyl-carrier-protein] synthase II
MSLGEGGAVLVLESAEHAAARGARPLVEVLGAGGSCDATHMTAPHAEGVWAAASIEAALRDAGLDREDIDYLNAHGTGTALNDSAERATMAKALGARSSSIPVEATKSVVGHLLGAAGAVEAVAVSLALMQREIHPVPGECSGDPALDLDLVHGTPRSVPSVRIGMSLSLGFGGANAALVLGRWDR